MNVLNLIPYGKAIAVAVILSLFGLYSYSLYNKGYHSAETKWTAKYTAREADLIEKADKERNRQLVANEMAKKAEAIRIAQLEAENQALEDLIRKQSDEAEQDPDANRNGVSDGSRMRIDAIR